MVPNITIGQFFPGSSPVHRVDPRMKIIFTALYITSVLIVKGFLGYAFIAVAFVIIAALSQIRIQYLIKGLKPILFVAIFTFVLNVFFTQGENPLFSIWRVNVYKEGILNAAFFALRLVFLVLGTSILTLTTSPMALTDALERIMKPLKALRFPVHELAMMMTIAMRMIPTIIEETDKIMKAQTARGADFESGKLISRAKAMIPLLVPLFVSAFRRADELSMAMESRCYRGDINRTKMKVLHLGMIDIYALLFMGLLIALILLEKWFL
jgi:energy-coupling factor transport system permease protein